jgi:O-antigen ligase
MTFSRASNPLGSEESTFRDTPTNTTHLFIIGITIALFAISRIIHDVIRYKERRVKPKLLSGFILLALSFLLGGLTTKYYCTKTVFFGLLQSITISFSYFIFFYTIDWKKVKKEYFPFLLLCINVLMLFECLNAYKECGILNTEEELIRKTLFTGWGIYNNIALICAITLPAPFYYAYTKNNKIPYIILAILMYLNLFILQSRNGILFGSIIFITGSIILFKNSKHKKILSYLYSSFFILTLIGSIILLPNLEKHFAAVIERGISISARTPTYVESIKMFLRSPLFGEGYYSFKGYIWNLTSHTPSFLPARIHNTQFQLIASCGLLGITSYIYHRLQTIKLLRNCKKDPATVLIKTSLITFLLMSLLDCHFHNLGPGFIYSAILLMIEKVYCKQKEGDLI